MKGDSRSRNTNWMTVGRRLAGGARQLIRQSNVWPAPVCACGFRLWQRVCELFIAWSPTYLGTDGENYAGLVDATFLRG
jgi:hypothetical protein